MHVCGARSDLHLEGLYCLGDREVVEEGCCQAGARGLLHNLEVGERGGLHQQKDGLVGGTCWRWCLDKHGYAGTAAALGAINERTTVQPLSRGLENAYAHIRCTLAPKKGSHAAHTLG